MCFSATASFTTAGLLAFSALLGFKKARTQGMRLFALTPFLFAIQQCMEGILWSTQPQSPAYNAAAYIFLSFASSWPMLMPSALMILEQDPRRKKIITLLFYVGCIFSAASLFYIATTPMTAQIVGGHVAYSFAATGWPAWIDWTRFVYLALVVLPPLVSSARYMWIFGLGVLATFIATISWYAHHVTSVWCFFAAILSGLILLIVWQE